MQGRHGCRSILLCTVVAVLALGSWSCTAAKTAYLLQSMPESNSANNTYRNLQEVLQPPNNAVYDTIVLLANYSYMPGQYDMHVNNQNLTITSAAGSIFTFNLNYALGAITINKANITFRNLAMFKTRKTSGQAIPFFQGDGMVFSEDVVRMRIGCASDVQVTYDNLVTSVRPAAFPGKQVIAYSDFFFHGTVYPKSIHMIDFASFIGPSDVGEFQMYAGYDLVHRNVTRVCLSYIPDECLLTNTPDVCLNQAIDAYLAQESGPPSGRVNLAAVIAGPVIAGVMVLAAAIGAVVWRRRQLRGSAEQLLVAAEEGSSKQQQRPLQQQQQPLLDTQGTDSAKHGGEDGVTAVIPTSFTGSAGTIEEVALGNSGPNSHGWRVMACHSAPEFKDVTPRDKITLGVLLGAGSFGRVYKGRWRGLEVAVKVLQHDSTSAAAVANEVDLVMSFEHPNVTKAYHFVTWNHTGRRSSGGAADSAATTAVAGNAKWSSSEASSSDRGTACKTAQSSSNSSTPYATALAEVTSKAPQQQQQEQQTGKQQDDVFVPLAVATGSFSGVNSSNITGCTVQTRDGTAVGCSAGNSSVLCIQNPSKVSDGSAHGYWSSSGNCNPEPCCTADPGASVELSSTVCRAGVRRFKSANGAAGKQLEHQHPWQQQVATPQAVQRLLEHDRRLKQLQQPCRQQHSTPVNAVQRLQEQQPQQHCGVMQEQFAPMTPGLLPVTQQRVIHSGLQSGDVCITMPAAPGTLESQPCDTVTYSAPKAQQLQQQPSRCSGSNFTIKPYGAATEAQTWLILEYCDGGTLLDIIEGKQLFSRATDMVDLAHVLTLLCDIASGMLYLHSRNVLHGDLKPGNVLLKRQQGASYGHQAKITDFGLSRSLKAGQSHRSTRTMGTVNHTPPELLRLGRISPASDVYAFATMMWELYTGKVAWSGMHYGEVFERVALLQERPPIPSDMPEAYANLMMSSWSPDPFQRPSFGVILEQLQDMLARVVQGEQDAQDRFVSDL